MQTRKEPSVVIEVQHTIGSRRIYSGDLGLFEVTPCTIPLSIPTRVVNRSPQGPEWGPETIRTTLPTFRFTLGSSDVPS